LQSKRGLIITGVILGAITVASFAVWMIPQNTQTQFVVSNAKEELDALIEQQKTIADSTTEEFNKMLAGEITPENYIGIAEISSSQVNSFIIKTIETDAPTEWSDSYSAFGDSLRSYNSYIRESIVAAEKLKADAQADISEEKTKLDEFLKDMEEFLRGSNDSRPS
jgi:F0F1-type ATP synthase membrane subunit b/b'